MQMIANDGLASWPISRIDASAAAMRFWLLQKGHTKDAVEIQTPQIIAALKTTIASTQAAWILAPRDSRLAELSITKTDENSAILEQRIDLTFIDADVRWIIDYKLGLDVNMGNLHLTAQTHKPQLASYASLFACENLPIKTAVLFLSIGQLVEI
jgi:ATP-dependent helicase/nuclease subunit A